MDFFIEREKAVMGQWPEGVAPALLGRFSDLSGEAAIVRGMLESFGVASVVQYPLDGEFGTVILGTAPAGVDVYVPETQLEDAKNLLNSDNIQENEEE